MLWTRTWSGLLGVLLVFGAWLLASQVFAGQRRPLIVALLVATEPMIGYWSGLVSNDISVMALFTLALAQMAFILRTPPDRRQGFWMGGVLAVALLTKSTALTLLPLTVLALAAQGLTYKGSWREIRATSLRAMAVLAIPAIWYVWSKIAYGTFTGEVLVGGVATSNPGGASLNFGLHDYYITARAWFADIYRTAWFHFFNYEAPRGSFVYYAPGALIIAAWLGVLGFAAQQRRRLFDASDARLRQAALCFAACVVLTLPFLHLELSRASEGLSFIVNGGRFLLPSYAGFVVVAVLGLDWLISERARKFAFSAIGAGSIAFLVYVWHIHFVARYYSANVSWTERFHRMSFDRPWFVVPATYWISIAMIALTLAGFALLMLRGDNAFRMPRRRAAAPA